MAMIINHIIDSGQGASPCEAGWEEGAGIGKNLLGGSNWPSKAPVDIVCLAPHTELTLGPASAPLAAHPLLCPVSGIFCMHQPQEDT